MLRAKHSYLTPSLERKKNKKASFKGKGVTMETTTHRDGREETEKIKVDKRQAANKSSWELDTFIKETTATDSIRSIGS